MIVSGPDRLLSLLDNHIIRELIQQKFILFSRKITKMILIAELRIGYLKCW